MDGALDLRHLRCPLPVIKTNRALRGLSPGEVLEIWVTDEQSLTDIPAYCRDAGHELLVREQRDTFTCFRIQRG